MGLQGGIRGSRFRVSDQCQDRGIWFGIRTLRVSATLGLGVTVQVKD